jgi:hypothetical protein
MPNLRALLKGSNYTKTSAFEELESDREGIS